MQRKGSLLAVAVLSAFVSVGQVWAQDPISVAPEMYRQLFENERIRVLEVTFQPGQSIPVHSHPDHAVYVLEAGKLNISKPDGSTMDADLQVGQVLWITAETHQATNTGSTVVRLLVTELKDGGAAPAPSDAMSP